LAGHAKQWKLIELICFAEPDSKGAYLNAADYGVFYALAPNIQNAFEMLDNAVMECRKSIKEALSKDND
jgi:hypothetical protein